MAAQAEAVALEPAFIAVTLANPPPQAAPRMRLGDAVSFNLWVVGISLTVTVSQLTNGVATISNVPIGSQTLTVKSFNSKGVLVGSAQVTVNVVGGITSTTAVTLQPPATATVTGPPMAAWSSRPTRLVAMACLPSRTPLAISPCPCPCPPPGSSTSSVRADISHSYDPVQTTSNTFAFASHHDQRQPRKYSRSQRPGHPCDLTRTRGWRHGGR